MIFLLAGLAIIYSILGKIGLEFASINPNVSAIWPHTGFAIAALLIFGVRMWPFILIGSLFVNLTTSGLLFSSLGIAVDNSLEVVKTRRSSGKSRKYSTLLDTGRTNIGK